jgi:hemoglobin/transferrin/lactoferrin receptor protein
MMRKKISVLGIAVFICTNVFNQEKIQQDSTQTIQLQEVTISSLRNERKLKEIAIPIEIVDKRQITKLSPVTPADILSKQPGISLRRDGIWATSVNIRGLSEQRIVTLVDGNRVETATDIAAGLSLIDMNDIERVEVIKGGASSIYGTGAIGGVVNFITTEGYYSDKAYLHGKTSAFGQTVNTMHAENLQIKTGSARWYLKLNGSIRNAHNTMTPDSILSNSQFNDNSFSVTTGIKTYKNQELKLNFQQFNASDVGIPGGAAFAPTAVAQYPKEQRTLYSAEYTFTNISENFKSLKFKYFHQYILRDVKMQASPTVLVTPKGNHYTEGGLIQGNFKIGNIHHIVAGTDVWQRRLNTEREKKISTPIIDSTGTQTGTNITIKGEVPIPSSQYLSSGLFAQDEIYIIENKLNLLVGARVDQINVINEQAIDPKFISINGVVNNNPPKQRVTFEKGNVNDVSWSVNSGLLFKANKQIDVTLNISHAFRSPSLEERFKYIDLGSTVQYGDPNLKPEQGWFVDLGTRYFGESANFSINAFSNYITDYIADRDTTIMFDRIDIEGKIDTVKAKVLSNIDQAHLFGFDAGFKFEFIHNLSALGTISFVRGMDTKTNTSLPQIPPLNGSIGLSYNFSKILEITAQCVMANDQNKVAAGEKATSGYARYDLSFRTSSVKIGSTQLYATGGIENITDRAYRNHLATNRGIVKSEPGRNFFGRIVFEF